MSFGVNKCAYIGLKCVKVYSIQDIELYNGESIRSLTPETAYKYLGILEADIFQQSKMRSKVVIEGFALY